MDNCIELLHCVTGSLYPYHPFVISFSSYPRHTLSHSTVLKSLLFQIPSILLFIHFYISLFLTILFHTYTSLHYTHSSLHTSTSFSSLHTLHTTAQSSHDSERVAELNNYNSKRQRWKGQNHHCMEKSQG